MKRIDAGITILLDGRGSRQYYPGETLAGSYRFDSVGGDDIQAVEISILWQTEGMGNTDIGVHAFWRLDAGAGDWIDPRRPGRFSTILPEYSGKWQAQYRPGASRRNGGDSTLQTCAQRGQRG